MCAQQGPASTFVEESSKKDRRFYRVCATAICAHAGEELLCLFEPSGL